MQKISFAILFLIWSCASWRNFILFGKVKREIPEKTYILQGSFLIKGWGLENRTHKEVFFQIPEKPLVCYLYWAGRNQTFVEDPFLFINGKKVRGHLIYEEMPGAPPPEIQYIFTLRYDITKFVHKGKNKLLIWGFDVYKNEGLGILAIYEHKNIGWRKIKIKEGLGFFWAGLPEPQKQNSRLVEFKLTNPETTVVRIGLMFAGGEPSPRDDNIWMLASEKRLNLNSIIGRGEIIFKNALNSEAGKQWDCLDFNYQCGPDKKYLYLQVESPQNTSSPHKGDSLNFILAVLEESL